MNDSLCGSPEALAAFRAGVRLGSGVDSLMNILETNQLKYICWNISSSMYLFSTFLQASLKVFGQKLHLKGFEFWCIRLCLS